MSRTITEISIIIVSWNSKEFLHRCLTSLYQNPPAVSFEVIVVDNNSVDNSAQMIKKSFPRVRLIKNVNNPGYSSANNQAIAVSNSRYVLLLNPDTVVLPNTFDAMIEFMNANPDVGVVGPQLLNPDRSIQPSGNRFPSLTRIIHEIVFSLFPQAHRLAGKVFEEKFIFGRDDFGCTYEVDEISGACLMVRRQVIDQIGLLDENFFVYYEDVDWCYRIKRAGWKILYLPQAKVIHHWRRGGADIGTQAAIEHYRSRYLFFKKHYGTVSLIALKIITVCFLLIDTTKGWLRCIMGSKARNEIQKIIGHNLQVIRISFQVRDLFNG